MQEDPVRPQNVRVVHADGSATPVELAYRGFEDDAHVWDCITPVEPGDHVKADTLPARTAIAFPFMRGDDDCG